MAQPNRAKKGSLREKVVHMYDALLDEDDLDRYPHFWDELFVLKPKPGYLASKLLTIDDARLVQKTVAVHRVAGQAVRRLDTQTNSELAVFNSLLTLFMLLEDLTRRKLGNNLEKFLFDSSNQEAFLKDLLESLRQILDHCSNSSVLRLTLRFLLLLVAAKERIEQNLFVSGMMDRSLFEAFMKVLADPPRRKIVGYEIVTLLGVLPHYPTLEPESNPYLQLSVMEPSIELMGIAGVMGESFQSSTREFFQQVLAVQKDNGWMTWITKTVTRTPRTTLNVHLQDAMLLSLCTGLKIGRNFVHAFTHAQSEILVAGPPPTPTVEALDNVSVTSEPAVVTPKEAAVEEPSNLFVEFLQYTSIVLQLRDEKSVEHARMSLLILGTITEDHYTTQFMHDFSINYRVQFYRAASRYHPCQILQSSKPEPLACAVLNLISEFITSHMMLNFPHDLYFRCLLVVYRLMDYQKRTRFRLPYQWRTLWSALLSLLKFLQANEGSLIDQIPNFFLFCTQVVNILNIFLIGGDAILSQVGSYDDLCYEIVRNSTIVNNAFTMGLRFSTVQSASIQASSKKFLTAMTNLRAVVAHFAPKVDAFSLEFGKTTLEREEILRVIQKHYDTLNLKLVDMNECFEKNANGRDKEFMSSFLVNVLKEIRTSCFSTSETFLFDPMDISKLSS
ncbi:hypothetical protein RvY_07610 [Ramazzottius varieornatus]|uniref:Armadillo-like helical domain-containing protein n=1 Tax=Ramazzottius varieornatus TaxID=947166 RepID=A0A1D1V313_RAMVA|nr:hypothetical protein RvY_07610 [Ramazzottius varieornatus]